VLAVFVWAFPHQYRATAPPGTAVDLDFGDTARFHLVRGTDGWELHQGGAVTPVATLAADMNTAWRQLTGAPVGEGAVATTGDPELARPLLDVRGIIV